MTYECNVGVDEKATLCKLFLCVRLFLRKYQKNCFDIFIYCKLDLDYINLISYTSSGQDSFSIFFILNFCL
jgi:hypothetical protein